MPVFAWRLKVNSGGTGTDYVQVEAIQSDLAIESTHLRDRQVLKTLREGTDRRLQRDRLRRASGRNTRCQQGGSTDT